MLPPTLPLRTPARTEHTHWRSFESSTSRGPQAWRPEQPLSQIPRWRGCVGPAAHGRSESCCERPEGEVSDLFPTLPTPNLCEQGHPSAECYQGNNPLSRTITGFPRKADAGLFLSFYPAGTGHSVHAVYGPGDHTTLIDICACVSRRHVRILSRLLYSPWIGPVGDLCSRAECHSTTP